MRYDQIPRDATAEFAVGVFEGEVHFGQSGGGVDGRGDESDAAFSFGLFLVVEHDAQFLF